MDGSNSARLIKSVGDCGLVDVSEKNELHSARTTSPFINQSRKLIFCACSSQSLLLCKWLLLRIPFDFDWIIKTDTGRYQYFVGISATSRRVNGPRHSTNRFSKFNDDHAQAAIVQIPLAFAFCQNYQYKQYPSLEWFWCPRDVVVVSVWRIRNTLFGELVVLNIRFVFSLSLHSLRTRFAIFGTTRIQHSLGERVCGGDHWTRDIVQKRLKATLHPQRSSSNFFPQSNTPHASNPSKKNSARNSPWSRVITFCVARESKKEIATTTRASATRYKGVWVLNNSIHISIDSPTLSEYVNPTRLRFYFVVDSVRRWWRQTGDIVWWRARTLTSMRWSRHSL